nr:hypothetical protein [Acinetobacter baumannii]
MDILEIEEKIGKVFNKTTPTGRLSKVKTRNLTSFFMRTCHDWNRKNKKRS